ncbi:MAG: M28 family peptidase [Pseudomonadota bacterium]
MRLVTVFVYLFCFLTGMQAFLGESFAESASANGLPAVEGLSAPFNADADALRADLLYLADDARGGRETGADGFNDAARYVAGRMAAIGLEPGLQRGYFQPVPLTSARLRTETARMMFEDADGRSDFRLGDEYVVRIDSRTSSIEAAGPVVYVGYGIVDPLARRNDYLNLSVEGKIVAVLEGAPKAFEGDEGAYLSYRASKIRTAKAHGAIGVIFLRTPKSERSRSWGRLKQAQNSATMSWRIEEQPNEEQLIEEQPIYEQRDGALLPLHNETESAPSTVALKVRRTSPDIAAVTLNRKGARKLFRRAPMGYDEIYRALAAGGVAPQGFALDATLSLSADFLLTELESANVIGVIPGADPSRADEIVAVTAHLDHVGSAPVSEDGDAAQDVIYNGALDNALGVAVILNAARRIAAAPPMPRTIAFIATTAEEKGLVGAEYLMANPPFGDQQVVANINIDMPLLLFPITDVIGFGGERSDLGAFVAAAAAQEGLGVSRNAVKEQNFFLRSDQFRFVERGIPSVFLFVGFGGEGRKTFDDFVAAHYHKPSDDAALPIDYDSAVRFSRFSAGVIRNTAQAEATPAWRPRDFFGLMFGGRFTEVADNEASYTP